MANEITVSAGLTVLKDKLNYKSLPQTFRDDMVGAGVGGAPGNFKAATGGIDIDASILGFQTPGWCKITNLDATNFVTYGIFATPTFIKLGELLPGQGTVLRLTRDLVTQAMPLRFVGDTASVDMKLEIFEA